MPDSAPQYPVYKAVQVANKFIELGRKDGITDLTNMKLQKLVFFAHSAMLGDYDRPLIKEDFRALDYGPVVWELYATIRNFCSKRRLGRKHCFSESLPDSEEAASITDQDALEAISVTWKVCKNSKASLLTKMTHLPGTPWSIVMGKQGPWAIIPNELIRTIMQSPLKE